jgi:hypothetical protein
MCHLECCQMKPHAILKITSIEDMEISTLYYKGLITFLAVVGLSNSIVERDLPGFYYTKDYAFNLTLFNDSSFHFKNRIGYKKSVSSGTWSTNDEKFLVLKSSLVDLLNTPVKVFESKRQEVKDSLFFKINSNFAGDSCCYYIIRINDSIKILSNKTHFQSQMSGVINKLKLIYACPDYSGIPYPVRDTVGTVEHFVTDQTLNVFKFDWNYDDELFYYEVFNFDTIEIQNKYFASP